MLKTTLANPSLITRIAIGKTIGLLLGVGGFIYLLYFFPESGWLLRWGILLWYATFGAIIGVFGVFTYYPMLKFTLPWWFRGAFLGGWLNFVLTFFAYDAFAGLMVSMFGENGLITSPFWFVLEGVLVGLMIDFFATRFGGEGKEVTGK